MANMSRRLRLAAAMALLLCAGSARAYQIYCGCNMQELQPASNFGSSTPTCSELYCAISDADGVAPSEVRNVAWFSNSDRTAPYPAANRNIRAVSPWSMNVAPGGAGTPARVNLATLTRTPADPIGGKAISARITLATGSIVEVSANIYFTPRTVRDPADPALCPPPAVPNPEAIDPPQCRYAGIARDPAPATPVCNTPPQLPACTGRGIVTFQANGVNFEALVNRINTLCENATLNINGNANYVPALGAAGQPPSPIVIARAGVKINAVAGITIDYTAAPVDSCMFRIFARNVEVTNIALAGNGGACVCGGASAGVKLTNMKFRGASNLRVKAGASVASITGVSFEAGNTALFGIINAGTIEAITSARWTLDVRGAAIMNYGFIKSVANCIFRNTRGEAGGTCSAAGAVVVNAAGGVLSGISRSAFSGITAGKAIWNDGKMPNGISSCTFTTLSDGAIVVGPSGTTGPIFGNTFTTLIGASGAGVLNYGQIDGINNNTFSGSAGEVGGITISQESAVAELASCGVPSASPSITTTISGNTFTDYEGGLESCGAISIAGGSVGNFTGTWNAILGATYALPPPAARTGIVSNTFRSTTNAVSGATNPLFAVCVGQGAQVSMIALNTVTFPPLAQLDSGAGISNGGLVAYAGGNVFSGFFNSEGGAINCGVTEYVSGPLAGFKLLINNTMARVPNAQIGGCINADVSCGIQFLNNNRCTRTPTGTAAAGYFFAPRANPTLPGTPAAVVCGAAGNSLDGAPRNLPRVGIPAAAACPVRPDGLWFQGAAR